MTEVIKTQRGVGLRDHEIANRAAPRGRLPVRGAKSNPNGDPAFTVISDGSPAAQAAAAERHDVKHKPDLVVRRMRGGK
jgi:hypothetical protein